MLQDDLEQLKAIILRDNWEEEDKRYVLNLEQQFKKAVAAEELVKHSAIAPYIQYLKDEIARCNLLLSEDDTLDTLARSKYFERKRACQEFLSHFGDTQQLEQTIKSLLDVAKSS